MKTRLDPQTGQPYVDPATGAPIDVSTKAGKRLISQILKARKQSAKASGKQLALARKQALQQMRQAANMPPGVSVPTIVAPGSVGLPGSMPLPTNPSCSGTCFPNVGWMGEWMTALGSARRFVGSLNGHNQVFLPSAQPLILAHDTPTSLINACMLAVQGDATKVVAQTPWPNPAADTTLSLAGAKIFGALVRISDNLFNFNYGTYRIQFLDGATLRSEVYVRVASLPVELVILSISSASGLASVVPTTAGAIKFVAADNPALVPDKDILYAESLNMKDLGDVVAFNQGGVMNLR